MRRGILIVLSSPSGAGKSTLARTLLQTDRNVVPSVSCTTRPRRHSEVDGIHYRFVSPERFADLRESGEFLEWARVHGNLYGTPKGPVEAALAAGQDVVFDIDWQGTLDLYEAMRDDIVSVFLLPPSAAELEARLNRRAEDPPEVIRNRLSNARDEIARWRHYDHVLVNRDLGQTFAALRSLIEEAREGRELTGAARPSRRLLPRDVDSLVDDLDAALAEMHGGQSGPGLFAA